MCRKFPGFIYICNVVISMAYIALYRKWRPQTFDEVVEQDSVVSILKNAVKQKRIAHAYLFCGTRGTGKTTMAKIFARAVNCLHPVDGNPCNECEICKGLLNGSILDVTELDAASNNGVDNIRTIIDESVYATAQAAYRVYIIDEVHMLSDGAFNALLKTLEEPPANVIFILATTEPHKLPVTILSRCQRYDFKRISRDGIVSRLEEICQHSDVDYEPAALSFIAQKADGALRDAISLLDQAIGSSQGNVTIEAARSASGSLDRETVESFCQSLLAADGIALLEIIDKIFADGRDPSNFIGEIMNMLRDIMIVLTVRNPENMLVESPEELEGLKELASMTNISEVAYLIKELSLLDNSIKWAVQRKIVFEAGILKLCDRRTEDSDMALRDRINLLEQRLADLVASGIKMSYRTIGKMQAAPVAPTIKSESEATPKIDFEPTAVQEPESKSEARPATASTLSPIEDELDWSDFLSAISDRGKAAAAALIRTNSTGYVMNDSILCIVFDNENMMRMIDKKDYPLLAQCATRAFGKEMRILVTGRSKVDTVKAEEAVSGGAPAEKEEKKENLEDALSILQQLSGEEGFHITEEN